MLSQNFIQHISQTCRCCFYRIRQYMYFAVAKTIATALVSKLDYCNSLYHNIAVKDILKLQHVQNCLGRVVTQSPLFSHSVPLLKSFLSDITLFSRSAQLLIKHFHPSNQHIYIHRSLLQDIFSHLILIYICSQC